MTEKINKAKIFLSYAREDESAAKEIYTRLKKEGFSPWMDKEDLLPGQNWDNEISQALKSSQFIIILFSTTSTTKRGYIQREFKLAIDLLDEIPDDQIFILPVRLDDCLIPEKYTSIQYCDLFEENGIEKILKSIKTQIGSKNSGSEFIKKASISDVRQKTFESTKFSESPGGAINPESTLYIERSCETIVFKAIQRLGVTITIKGTYHMGKTSLLLRLQKFSALNGKRVAFLNFHLIDKSTLKDADTFFKQFCSWISDELGINDKVDNEWKSTLGNSQNCTRYFNVQILNQLDSPVVIIIDGIEIIADSDFCNEFFAMLRAWHNKRVFGTNWQKLDLVFSLSTETYFATENINQSPFSVGVIVELNRFTNEEASELNLRYGSPLNEKQLKDLMALVNGHPFLIGKSLYNVAHERFTIENLFVNPTDDIGPYGDHLRYIYSRICRNSDFLQEMQQVIRNQRIDNESIYYKLKAMGIIEREDSRIIPTCKLYEAFFRKKLGIVM